MQKLLVLFIVLVGCGGDGDSGPPEIAGTWVHCSDRECSDTLRVGWHFPEDRGAVMHVVTESDRETLCLEDTPLFEDSTWEEVDGGVLIKDVVGAGDISVMRHGDKLPTLNDGIIYMFPPDATLVDPAEHYLVKTAEEARPCSQ